MEPGFIDEKMCSQQNRLEDCDKNDDPGFHESLDDGFNCLYSFSCGLFDRRAINSRRAQAALLVAPHT